MSDVERVTLWRYRPEGKEWRDWRFYGDLPAYVTRTDGNEVEGADFVPAAALDAAVRERDEARRALDGLSLRTAEDEAREAIRERDEALAEAERLRAAISSIKDLTLYPGAQDEGSDSLGTMVFAVCQHALHGDDLPAGSRVGGAAAGDADANPSGLRTDAPGGQDLNYLHGERDGQKWADAFLTVVPGADHDLMHTWFANAIETGYGLGREDGVARRAVLDALDGRDGA